MDWGFGLDIGNGGGRTRQKKFFFETKKGSGVWKFGNRNLSPITNKITKQIKIHKTIHK